MSNKSNPPHSTAPLAPPPSNRSSSKPQGGEDQLVGAGSAPAKAESKLKPKKPQSVSELIAKVLKSSRPGIDEAEIRAVKEHPNLLPEETPNLLAMAEKKDVNLDIARTLMMASVAAYPYPRVAETLREFTRALCVRHRAVHGFGELVLFPEKEKLGLTELESVIQRLRHIMAPADPAEKTATGNVNSKATIRERRALKRTLDNLVFVTIAWRFVHGTVDEAEMITLARRSLFPAEEMSVREREIALLRLFANLGEKRGLSALLRFLHEKSTTERDALAQARLNLGQRSDEIAGLERERDSLENAKNDLEQKLAQYKQEVDALKAEIEHMQESAKVSKVHHVDDLSTLRFRVLNMLVKEHERLSESITALSREPPKVEVARAYLGAVHDALTKEINRLKDK